ncbi:MAG: N-methyl-L-tryptophan oxidase [Pseudomonadota bacterium]
MHNPTFDVIVLGTGGIGSATLLQCAQRGVRCLGLDQFAMAHARGSSHGDTRAIRKAYFEHPDYVPLLQRAYTLWHQLDEQRQANQQTALYHASGVLSMGSPGGEIIQGIRLAAAQHNLPLEEIDETSISQHFPGIQAQAGHQALLEPDGGYLMVEAAITHQIEAAVELGAEYLSGVTVNRWHCSGSTVTVETSAGKFQAHRLIVTAGAWAAQLMPELAPHLRVVRKHLHWFAPREEQLTRQLPVFFFELDNAMVYGFPQIDDQGVKIANHAGGEQVADPMHLAPDVDPFDQALIKDVVTHHLPAVSLQATRHAVCMYTRSPDDHFIVDQHPEHSQLVFTAGLSGHGYKFAPVLGEVLTQLALDGATHLPIDFLRTSRFNL